MADYMIAHWRGLLGLRWTCLASGLFVITFGYLLFWLRIFIAWATTITALPLIVDMITAAFLLSLFWYVVGIFRSSWRTLVHMPITAQRLLGIVASLSIASLAVWGTFNYARQTFGF